MPNRMHKRNLQENIVKLLFCVLVPVFSFICKANSDLSYQLPAHNYAILSIPINDNKETNAETDASNLKIPVVTFAARQAIVKGVVIIIGDIQAQGFVDDTFLGLANTLPEWGWNTLLITPQIEYLEALQPAFQAINNGLENELTPHANNQANNSDSPVTPSAGVSAITEQSPQLSFTYLEYEHFLAQVMKALQSDFIPKSGYQMVLTKGKSAAAISRWLNTQQDSNINALVINSPHWPTPLENNQIPAQIAALSIPILDLVSLSDSRWSAHSQQQRLITSRVQLKSLYRQREIVGSSFSPHNVDYIAKEVVAWTRYLGW